MSAGESTRLAVEDRHAEARALELRLGGASYRQIGHEQGCSTSTAHLRVTRALRRLVPEEDARTLRSLEGQRLDALTLRLFERLEDPRTSTDDLVRLVGMLLRVSERRSRLFGLDAPVQVVTDDEVNRQIAELVDELTRRPRPEQAEGG